MLKLTAVGGREPSVKKNIVFRKPIRSLQAMEMHKRKEYVVRCGFCSTRPAQTHKDALITSNGTVKMLIYGDPYDERILFDQEWLYTPQWKEPPRPPHIADSLADIRKLLANGHFQDAPKEMIEAVIRDPVYKSRMPLSPDGKSRWSIKTNGRHIAFFMRMNTKPSGDVKDYLRTMNFITGEGCIHWNDRNGKNVRRGFVSRRDQTACQFLVSPEKTLLNTDIAIRLEEIPHLHPWDGLNLPENIQTDIRIEEEFIVFIGKYDKEYGQKAYIGVTRVVRDGGESTIVGDVLKILGANSVILLTKIERFEVGDDGISAIPSCIRHKLYDETFTDKEINCYHGYCFEDSLEKAINSIKNTLKILPTDYDVLLQRNEEVHGVMMKRSTIELCKSEDIYYSTEELIAMQRSQDDLNVCLLEKLYHMGRYYLLSDTGNLPPAHGQYNINVNLQVCSGNVSSLPEPMMIFFRFFESKLKDFRENAKNIFGCRGILASIHPDFESGYLYHFSVPWPHLYWISCAGWVYNEFWKHYLVTADINFLRDHIIPGLREIALFYEDYLSDMDEEGNLIFYPCFSPENGQRKGYPITMNAVMDILVCREVLMNLIEGCETLNMEADQIIKWEAMLDKMPPLLLDEEGALREWAWDSIEDDYEHRHVSHHYGVWPGDSITVDETPELARAVLMSNRKRGQENDSAHGIVHRLFTAIRLKDTLNVTGYLKQLTERGFVNYSLMTNHFPHKAYYPDVIGAMPATMIEMIVFSKPSVIELLPALPGQLSIGVLIGVSLYTYAKLEQISWDLVKGNVYAEIISLIDQKITLNYRYGLISVLINGEEIPVKEDSFITSWNKGEKKQIQIKIISK